MILSLSALTPMISHDHHDPTPWPARPACRSSFIAPPQRLSEVHNHKSFDQLEGTSLGGVFCWPLLDYWLLPWPFVAVMATREGGAPPRDTPLPWPPQYGYTVPLLLSPCPQDLNHACRLLYVFPVGNQVVVWLYSDGYTFFFFRVAVRSEHRDSTCSSGWR